MEFVIILSFVICHLTLTLEVFVNAIDKKFIELKRQKKKAFIVFITAGDPNLSVTKKLILEFEKTGVDLIEIGIPFSDPLADGPTIQASSSRALKNKVTLHSIIRAVSSLKNRVKIPLVFMTYYNPVFNYGLKKFVSDCKRAGVSGVIIPDMPYEESSGLRKIAKKADFSIIFLAAPTSTRKRLVKISKVSRGFIYFVSLTGVTGARKMMPRDLVENVKKLKRLTKKPVCVGFGVSDPKQAKNVARIADGVIVGSAIVKLIGKKSIKKAISFVRKLGNTIHEI